MKNISFHQDGHVSSRISLNQMHQSPEPVTIPELGPTVPARGEGLRTTRVRTSVSTFLQKLFEICSSIEHREAIAWSEDGLSFEVVSRSEFEKVILPTYFKHANMNSFVRQLNMYDFHKTKQSNNEHCFTHQLFIRDKK